MLDPSLEVADPNTSAERLAEIAAQEPALRSRIAVHPNCYPELHQWIAQYATPAAPEQFAPLARKPTGRFWTRTKVIISGTLAFVGAVTGVVSVIPILTRDATNFSHLEITATPVTGEVTEWAIPLEALDEEFPSSDTACGPEQSAWLQAHAEPIQRSFMLNTRNTANDGPMLALVDFRATTSGDSDRSDIRVRLVCEPTGTMPELMYYGKLMADDPEQIAVHTKIQTVAVPTGVPEMPVTFNLAPGESGKIPLELFSRNVASGSIQVTVLSRDERQKVHVEGSDFKMPALLFGGEMYLFTSPDGLSCHRVEAGTLFSCTIDDLRMEMDRAER